MGERTALRARVTGGLVAVTAVQDTIAASDPEEMLAVIRRHRPPTVVIDRDHASARETLQQIERLPQRERPLTIVIVPDASAPPVGARVIVHTAVLEQAMKLVDRVVAIDLARPIALDRMLGVTLLGGALDQALDTAAVQLASAFGVDRCVLSIRGDSAGGAASGTQTWDSLAWSATADYCRAAAQTGATVVAPAVNRGDACESYLAVPLGNGGFLALVVERPRIYSREHQATLHAVAARLSTEIGWRNAHQRTVDELERQTSSPGIDPLLGVWNRMAMSQLSVMQVSAARRTNTSLVAIVVDVVSLAGINTRHSLEVGDRVLRRIVDAIRVSVRAEDVVGRWAGDEIAVLLPATMIEGAERVAQRFQKAFAERPLELSNGEVLPIEATVGLASLTAGEDADAFVGRAAWTAKRAETTISIARASTGPSPRFSDADLRVDLAPSFGGTYRVLHEISRGGMGVVYRAEDLALERPVAIKMLRPDLAEDTSFVEGLRKEAAILARLQHPNLVQIYNFGQSGGDSYFVMELVEGEGMQQAFARHRIEDTSMPLTELMTMVEQIASALDALHERGVIHRDIKPANIIRDPFQNRSVLVDVGIARRYGQFVEGAGTPGYCAPEVIVGGEATARSDVYGLAATAYTLLTLWPPWGEGEGVLARQCSGQPPPLASSHREELDVIDEVLMSALASDPADRPASAGAFARALRAAAAPLIAPSPRDESRWHGHTILPSRSRTTATTRGVVFRSVIRALGVRDGERLRDAIGGTHPELARAITDAAPLSWLPTEMLTTLLALVPEHLDRERTQLARDIARAAVRASFRRFFPASAATLVPERTLSAIRGVWARYQSWGVVTSMPVQPTETVIRITNTLRDPELCAWTSGMLEQLVVLSGAKNPIVDHEACEARGDDACLYRVMWT
jgi:diguanylate cyclase (GGDEF)-like protein